MALLEEAMGLYEKVLAEKKYNSPITAGFRQWIITAFGRDGQMALKGTTSQAATPRNQAAAKVFQKFAHPAEAAGKEAPKSAGAPAGLGRPKFKEAAAPSAVASPRRQEEPTRPDTDAAPVAVVDESRAEMVARAVALGYDTAERFSDKQLKKVLNRGGTAA